MFDLGQNSRIAVTASLSGLPRAFDIAEQRRQVHDLVAGLGLVAYGPFVTQNYHCSYVVILSDPAAPKGFCLFMKKPLYTCGDM